jgi:hypothetical protein
MDGGNGHCFGYWLARWEQHSGSCDRIQQAEKYMRYLKQSTTVTIQMGPFLDKTDGVTEETGLTPAIEVSKGGAAFAARNSATAVSHDAEGWYRVELNPTDTATLGTMIVKAQDSANHVPVWHEFMVLPANVYDSMFGSDKLQVDLTQIDGLATNGNNATLNLKQLNIQNDTAAALIIYQTDIVGTANAVDIGATSFAGGAGINIFSTAADAVILSAGGNGDALQLNGSGTGSGLSGTVEDLRTLGLDHLLAASVAGADVVDNSVVAKLVSSSATADWDTYDNTTDSQQAIRDSIQTPLDAAGVRSAIGLASANLDTQLADLPTATENADAMWEEILADHSGTVGSAAEALDAAGGGLTTSAIATAVHQYVVESGNPSGAKTFEEIIRIVLAAIAGVSDTNYDWGAKNPAGTKTRLGGTLDSSGRRTAVTKLDGS